MLTTKWKWALIMALCVVALFVASNFAGYKASTASYAFTIPASLCTGVLAGIGWARCRARGLYIAEIMFAHIAIFMLIEGVEEVGWAAWRAGIRPDWFQYTLANVFKVSSSTVAVSLASFGVLWAAHVEVPRIWHILRWLWVTLMALGAAVLLIARFI